MNKACVSAGWLSAGRDVLPDYSAQLVDMFQLYFAPAQVSDKESAAAYANRYKRLLLVLLCSTPHVSGHKLAFDAVIHSATWIWLPSSLQERERLNICILFRTSNRNTKHSI